jgi:GT2 family glycosyltransferase
MNSNSTSDLKRISAVIISYHSDEMVLRLIDKIPSEIPIVVIDNASDSALGVTLSEQKRSVRYKNMTRNMGFGVAANTGISMVETDYVVIINPDVELLPKAFAASIALMDEDTALGALGELRFMRVWRFRLGRYVTGAFLVLRRSAFEAVSGFDEDFFLFYEDSDISVRLERAGFSLGSIPHLTRHRDGHSVSPEQDSLSERLWLLGASARLFTAKHGPLTRAGLWVRWQMLRSARDAKASGRSTALLKGYREAKRVPAADLWDNFFTTGRRRS